MRRVRGPGWRGRGGERHVVRPARGAGRDGLINAGCRPGCRGVLQAAPSGDVRAFADASGRAGRCGDVRAISHPSLRAARGGDFRPAPGRRLRPGPGRRLRAGEDDKPARVAAHLRPSHAGPAAGPALPSPWPPRRTAVAPGRASRDRPSSPPRPGRPAKPSAAGPAGNRQHARGAAPAAPRRHGGRQPGIATPVQAGGSRGHGPHTGGRRRDRHRAVGPERTAASQHARTQPDQVQPCARAWNGRGGGSRHRAGTRPVAHTARRVPLRPRVLVGTRVHASINSITGGTGPRHGPRCTAGRRTGRGGKLATAGDPVASRPVL